MSLSSEIGVEGANLWAALQRQSDPMQRMTADALMNHPFMNARCKQKDIEGMVKEYHQRKGRKI